jgi:opacity protein-like surface antigen
MRKDLSAATAIGCLLACATVAAWPSAAAAQPEGPPPDYVQPSSGLYVAGEVGYNFPDSVQIIPYSPPRLRLNGSQGGIVFFDRLGYRVNPHWRVELEASYRPDWVSHAGATRNVNAMGNVLYDFMPDSRWTPFVGAGIGANTLNVNYTRRLGGSFITGRETRFAWQGIGGVSFVMSPHLNLDVTYRYTENEGYPHLRCFGNCAFAPKLGYNASNTISVGLRYAFGAPPAPPPPPPEAAPPPPPPEPPPPPPPEAAPPPPPEPAPPPPEPAPAPRAPRG